jgi:hypothetical protein
MAATVSACVELGRQHGKSANEISVRVPPTKHPKIQWRRIPYCADLWREVPATNPNRRCSSNASGLHVRNSAVRRKSTQSFKGIIRDDISEFESHMPSHAVGLAAQQTQGTDLSEAGTALQAPLDKKLLSVWKHDYLVEN